MTSPRSIALLRPGVRLMQRLPLPARLAAMAVTLLLPVIVALVADSRRIAAELVDLGRQREGLSVVAGLHDLAQAVRLHRGLMTRVRQGDLTATLDREAARTAMQQRLGSARARLQQNPHVDIGAPELSLQAMIDTLPGTFEGETPLAAFDRHSQVVEAIDAMALRAGESSGLSFAAGPGMHLRAQWLLIHLPDWAESVGAIRGLGSASRALEGLNAGLDDRLVGAFAGLQSTLRAVATAADSLRRQAGDAPASWLRAQAASTAYLRHATAALAGDAEPESAAGFFSRGDAVMSAIDQVGLDLQAAIGEQLDDRRLELAAEMATMLALLVLSLLGFGYLALAFHAASRGAAHALRQHMTAVERGDLARSMHVRGSDELAQVGRQVDRMNERVSLLVAQVRSNAAHVGMAGQQVADGSVALSARTEEQASSLRQTVQAIGEVSASAGTNAEISREVDRITRRLSTDVEVGGHAMQATAEAMARLRTASDEVGAIVAVIDDIAFQTGMLALNAAVEASHAGDAGRGFSVVAGEVRQLAQRCAESAEQIRHRVAESGAAVGESSARLAEAEAAFDSLRSGVTEVASRVDAITQASVMQSERLSDVASSVGNLDELTRRNAVMVEEATMASRELVDRADSLRAAVASIRLRHGSADEARQLVERAVLHIEAVGREQAYADFNRHDGGFVDRDLYLFGFSRDGVYTVLGRRPEMVGAGVEEVVGVDAEPFIGDAWRVADAGGGWLKYTMSDIRNGRRGLKESYIAAVGPDELLACGAAVDVATESTEPTAA